MCPPERILAHIPQCYDRLLSVAQPLNLLQSLLKFKDVSEISLPQKTIDALLSQVLHPALQNPSEDSFYDILLALYCLPSFLSAKNKKTTKIVSDVRQLVQALPADMSKDVFILLRNHAYISLLQMPREVITLEDCQGLQNDFTSRCCSSSIGHISTLVALLHCMKCSPLLPESQDTLWPLLLPNLTNQSYAIRLLTLKVLSSFSPLNYIPREDSKETPLNGESPCITMCLEIETSALSIETERGVVRQLERLEVLCRSRLLPSLHLAAVAHYSLGVLHKKLATLWPAAMAAFKAAAEVDLEAGWRPLLHMWGGLRNREVNKPTGKKGTCYRLTRLDLGDINDKVENGVADVMVASQVPSGALSILNTDLATATTSLLGTLKRCPDLILRKSKHVVPMFLRFLRQEYYVLYKDDPDIRELDLSLPEAEEQIMEGLLPKWDGTPAFTGKLMRTKLIGYLDVFASVGAARSLYRHHVLQEIFKALLSKPDVGIAKLALKCLMGYKLPYLVPHHESLQTMLDDSKLREELIRFSWEEVQTEHKQQFMSVVVRLLYGRFLMKSVKGRSAKDAPGVR